MKIEVISVFIVLGYSIRDILSLVMMKLTDFQVTFVKDDFSLALTHDKKCGFFFSTIKDMI